MKNKILFTFLLLAYTNLFSAGIMNQKAPEFNVDEWVQFDKKIPNIKDYKNKVLYIYGFQSWCPGCHAHGFPTLNKLSTYYKNDKDVKFVAIQTSFEGFNYNTADAAKKIIKRYNLTMPVAQSGINGKRSQFMIDYKTGGTPWAIIIDKEGVVRFNSFHIGYKEAINFIDSLK